MEEKDLITKIQRLKAIKPRENWVSLTKEEIFPKESRVSIFEVLSNMFHAKPVFVFAVFGIMILEKSLNMLIIQ